MVKTSSRRVKIDKLASELLKDLKPLEPLHALKPNRYEADYQLLMAEIQYFIKTADSQNVEKYVNNIDVFIKKYELLIPPKVGDRLRAIKRLLPQKATPSSGKKFDLINVRISNDSAILAYTDRYELARAIALFKEKLSALNLGKEQKKSIAEFLDTFFKTPALHTDKKWPFILWLLGVTHDQCLDSSLQKDTFILNIRDSLFVNPSDDDEILFFRWISRAFTMITITFILFAVMIGCLANPLIVPSFFFIGLFVAAAVWGVLYAITIVLDFELGSYVGRGQALTSYLKEALFMKPGDTATSDNAGLTAHATDSLNEVGQAFSAFFDAARATDPALICRTSC